MNIVLGVSGSVAAYRAADLARELMRAGHVVRTCLTRSAAEFVTPALFEALTGQPSVVSAFEEPDRGHMAHIEWARWADAVVVAPATANVIANLAHGLAEDMLTTIALATDAPLIVAPAMNPHMYAAEPTQAALALLASRAAVIVEPAEGDVACGEHGQGKLASVSEIAAATALVLGRTTRLSGKKLLVTSGPTQEPIDSVRFLTNQSSGKMGAAIARAGVMMGAEVVVIAGPSTAVYPMQARVISVRTAEDMLSAALAEAADADLIIGAAAVADYRPASLATGKIRRSDEPIAITLIPNPDVIAAVAAANPLAKVIGFAAEPTTDLTAARSKLARKGLHAIAANDISNDAIGFYADDNELSLITADGNVLASGRRSKLACAIWLIEAVA